MSGAQHTASSTSPNSSNFWRRVASSVCQARPLLPVSRQIKAKVGNAGGAYPMKSFVVEVILIALDLMPIASSGADEWRKSLRSRNQGGILRDKWKMLRKVRRSLPRRTQVVETRQSLVAKRGGKVPLFAANISS